jgi:hypothetical protein
MRESGRGRRQQPREERRKAQVEINLLADVEGDKKRRGCSVPFVGGGLLLLAIETVRIVTG